MMEQNRRMYIITKLRTRTATETFNIAIQQQELFATRNDNLFAIRNRYIPSQVHTQKKLVQSSPPIVASFRSDLVMVSLTVYNIVRLYWHFLGVAKTAGAAIGEVDCTYQAVVGGRPGAALVDLPVDPIHCRKTEANFDDLIGQLSLLPQVRNQLLILPLHFVQGGQVVFVLNKKQIQRVITV